MKNSKKKTVLNVLLIAFVVSFFVTPMGYYGKVWLHRLFASSPKIIVEAERTRIVDYDWKLKDADWGFFNFEKSRENVIFISIWASWKLPCHAELRGIQKLYDIYGNKVDFYIITNEEKPPVEEFMEKNKYTFPVTYLIIGEKMPINSKKVPSSYLIDQKGNIVIYEDDITSWNSGKVHKVIDALLAN
ncbi:MAG: hypothetical protein COA50_06610 [Flavobacteriaceae bacterium]|nr:MAG: hypothetical protein COA50_06610 [Flavobacteriaceae bacterium]